MRAAVFHCSARAPDRTLAPSMPRPLRRFLVLLASVVAGAAGAQDLVTATGSEFAAREWHAEAGLPNEDVFQLFQDRAGYLWVSCRGALCRFDGTTFTTETAKESRDIFYSMAEDAGGDLWLTGRDGNLLHRRNGDYRREPLPSPYDGRPVGGVFIAPDGAHWYTLRGAAVRVAGGDVQTFGAAEGVVSEGWTRFASDGAGNVWLVSHHFVARYEGGRLVPLPGDGDTGELRIASSRRDGPWLIASNRVLKLDARDQPVTIATIPPLLGGHYVNAALEDRNGALWLGTRSAGLHRIGADRQQAVAISSDFVTALLEDKEGVLWVATSAGGLNAVTRRVYALHNKASGLAATSVQAVCTDEAGDIWVANGDAGVARIRGPQIDRWPLLQAGRNFAAGSLTRHPDGGVWATGGAGTAVFWVPGDGRAASVVEPAPETRLHASTFTTKTGELWFATADRRVGRLQDGVSRIFGPADGVGAPGVRTFAESATGQLLVGTNDGTLLQFDGTRFAPSSSPIQVPSAINAIQTIGDELWLGTAANGLVISRGAKSFFLGRAQGLPDDTITQLMPDGRGFVWCGSGRGVFRLAVEDVQRFVRGETTRLFPLRLGKDEGLGSIACQGIYGPGVAKSRDGRIWFATRQGVLAVDPAAETLNPPLPKARIEQVLADEQALPLQRPWTVDPDARKLEFRFSVLCLSAPSRVHVRYRLVGFDNAWITGKPGETAAYPRLPPATYRFEVTAGFDDTVDARSGDSLEVVVPPLWWQTDWFRLPALGVSIAGLALIVRVWSHRRLRRKIANLEREAAVARVRERIASDIHDDVGASLTRICLLAHARAPDSPEAKNLAHIEETAREVTRSLDEIVWAVNPQYDTLEGLAGYLTNFAQKFLGSARIRCRLLIPPALPAITIPGEMRHDLFLCCREILNNVVKHAGATEVALRLSFAAPTLEIVLTDNGRGLAAPPPAASPDRISSGHGLENLRHRMERLGGRCAIESSAESGTTVTLRVDLPSPPARP